MLQNRLTMAKIASVFVFMVLLTVIVEGRDWRFETVKRIKRGYNTGGFGNHNAGYGQSDEQNASVSGRQLSCSDEQGGESYGSGSREVAYNRDDRSGNNNRRHRSFSKASATASASATAGAVNQPNKSL